MAAAAASSLAFGITAASADPPTATTLTTSLSDGTNTGATLTEVPDTAVTDSSTLTGVNAATAGGTVTYTVFSDSGCTTSFADGGTVTVASGSVPDSNPVTITTPGTYYWQASYSGDGGNTASTSTCGDEIETVTPPSTTTVTTTLSDGTTTGANLSEPENTAVTDTADLNGDNSGSAGGTVTYTVYSDAGCTTSFADGGTVTVTAGVVPASNPVSLAALGSYYWQASYSGDDANAAGTSTCGDEIETVTAASTTLTTTLSDGITSGSSLSVAENTAVTDAATLTGSNASSATGTVTYTVYSDGACTTMVGDGGTKTVTAGSVPASDPITEAAAGVYYWQASYTGDTNNAASSSTCGSEIETVFAPGSTVTATTVTTKHPSVTSGQPVTFTAKVVPSKVGHPPVKATGTVTFIISGSDSSTVSCTTTNSPAIGANGKAKCSVPGGVLVQTASPYTVTATYSGDATFAASSSTPISETVVVAKTKTKLKFDVKPTSGSPTTFTATVTSGPGTPLITGTVLFSVASTHHTGAKVPKCMGGDVQPLTGNTATCVLKAGWFVVPNASKNNPHPKTTWNVSADYGGDANFTPSHANKGGKSHV